MAKKPKTAKKKDINTDISEPEIEAHHDNPIIKKLIEDDPKFSELLKKDPELADTILTISSSVQYSGPLPHPSHLKMYDEILPGIASRIFKMVESDAEHIRDMQKESLMAKKQEITLGQVFGLIIGLVALICGTYSTVKGHPIAGTFIGVGGVGGLISVFILGREKNKKSN